MNLLWRRYTRSGYAPPWFYALMAIGFIALAGWAAVQRDWLVMALAVVMLGITVAGSRIMRRMSEAKAASQRAMDARKDGDNG
jgi:hypothetical protein